MGISPILYAAIRSDMNRARSAAERAVLIRDVLSALQAQTAMCGEGRCADAPDEAEIAVMKRLLEVSERHLRDAIAPADAARTLSALSSRVTRPV